MKTSLILLLTPALLASALAKDAKGGLPLDSEPSFLTFYLDNDLFGGKDQDYTNGAALMDLGESGH